LRQSIVRARIRPARVAVLINKQGTRDDFVLAVRFLSRLWGGMYAPIFPTNLSPPDDLTEFRLSAARPDYVYSIGLDGNAWGPRIQDACQPRGYRILDNEFLEQLYGDHYEQHVTDRQFLNFLFRRHIDGGPKRKTRLIFWDETSDLFPLAAALFGIPYKVRPNPYAPVEYDGDWGDQQDPRSLIKAHTAIVEKYEQCWPELTSQELDVRFHWGWTGPPTIVLVENIVEDLSLFWNLRMEGHASIPRWIIPIPASMTRDETHAAILKAWILGFAKYPQRPNHIFIKSRGAAQELQIEFAEWLRSNLQGTHIKFVDVCPPSHRVPVVTAFELEKLVEIRRYGRRANWLRPQSQVVETYGSRVSWMVDLLDEPTKKRSPFELFLPPRKSTVEILNAPNPPTVHISAVPVYGLGVDALNVRCTNDVELISHWLPTAEEILEELLGSCGLQIRKDEKRGCYLPAIRLLGGIEQASSALTGQRGAILQELVRPKNHSLPIDKAGSEPVVGGPIPANRPRGPATVDELKGRLQLGKGKIPELNRDNHFEIFFQQLTSVQKRVGRRRLLQYWRRTLPKDNKLQSLMEHWVSNSILTRLWRVGPCPACQTTHHEPELNIKRPYQCPGCGTSISIAEHLVVEYELQPVLEAALKEGLKPVALTGNFLKNLTNQGFLWLPGLKYTHNGVGGDIDIVASCDGHLVFAECKLRDQSDPDKMEWSSILDQVRSMATIARICKADLIVFAALIDSYPSHFRDEVSRIAGDDLPIEILNRDDLEKGYRWIKVDLVPVDRPLCLQDLIPDRFPEERMPKFDEPRLVESGGFTSAFGLAPPSQDSEAPRPSEPIDSGDETA
jgi:hypothetical protein